VAEHLYCAVYSPSYPLSSLQVYHLHMNEGDEVSLGVFRLSPILFMSLSLVFDRN